MKPAAERRPALPKLLIASHNAGKVTEIEALLSPSGMIIVSAADLQLPEPEETGATFTENAEIKSRAAAQASHLPSLADDSGLMVEALDGAPGIYSARWAGPGKNFAAAMDKIKQALTAKGIQANQARAAFICVLSLCFPDGRIENFEGRVDGTLTFPPRGHKGFGYDPIFIPEGDARTFGEMDPQEKQLQSHRARAFAKLSDYLGAL